MSKQERVSWVSLVVNVLIGYWYFDRVFSLPADTDLFGPAMALFAVNLIILSIVIGIASEVALRVAQKQVRGGESKDATGIDERDLLINLKASRNGGCVLNIGVFGVLVLIALLESSQRYWHRAFEPETVLGLLGTGPLAPMHIAQLLLLALTLAAVTVYASRIFHYRRGY